jgi:glutathione peroxidase
MKKLALLSIVAITFMVLNSFKLVLEMKNLHQFSSETLSGESFNFSELKGKRVLIVNTASKCGFTSQYEQLQELYDMYKDKNFVVIGFPSNDFGKQEPGKNEEIADFCKKNFGVTFPMMAKTPVKGDDQHPIYKWLTHKEENGKEDVKVSWNFNKFLIDENGQWVAHYGSRTKPTDEEIVAFAKGEE